MFLNKMTLANLVVLIAMGLVCFVTPTMAATFPDGAEVPDQTWKQGQPNISITFPTATAELDPPGALSATLEIGAVTFLPDATLTGILTGLTFTFDATTGVGKLEGDYAHNEITGLTLVTYTVDEAGGGDAVLPAFSVEIVEADELMFPAGVDIDDKELTVGTYFYEVLPAAQDGIGPLTYAITGVDTETPAGSGIFTGGELPAGLTFVPATRVLSGTPNAQDDRAVLTYTVTDSTPTTPVTKEISFTIEVAARVPGPSFAITKIDDAAYTKGHAITAMTLPAADTTNALGSVTYALAPLPKGLSFNATSRELSGTPNPDGDAVTTVTAMYTATDQSGNEASVPFEITVNRVVSVTAPANVEDHTLGEPFADITVTVPAANSGIGTGAKTVEVTGLPAGLTFADMAITGDPTATGTSTVRITATDSLEAEGFDEFTIEVVAAPVITFADVVAPQIYEVGKPITPMLLPEGSGGIPPLSYALDNLPAGITFDPTTRLLRGTPTTASTVADYDYVISDYAFGHIDAASRTADHPANSITLPITITVTEPVPVVNSDPDFGDATVDSIVATAGEAIPGRFLPEATDADGDDLTYSIVETLPDGLTFNPLNRALTGTPTTAMSETAYTYMVADGNGGTDTIGFFITVNAAPTPPPVANMPPAFAADARVDNIIATVGEAIQGLTLPAATDPEGDTLTYSISPALPTGLTFNATTRALTGTPTAMMAQTAYTYMVADGNGGTDTIGFFITVNAAPTPPPPVANMPPAFAAGASIDSIVATAGEAIPGRFLPAAIDPEGDTVRYWISPALPNGLVFNATTRALTGTPRAAMAQTAYTYNAADVGSLTTPAQLPFFITVNAAPNRAPVYADTTPIAITGIAGVAITPVTVAATDPDGDTLAYSWDVNEAALGLALNTSTGVISGTPLKAHTGSHPVTATDPGGLSATRGVNITIVAPPPPNVAPVVTIITMAPTAPQNDSFAIAYTATDANAGTGDTVTVSVTHTISPASATGYTVTHDAATQMVTITQAAGSPIAVVEVTITATDAAGLSDSESISVTFAAKGTPPVHVPVDVNGDGQVTVIDLAMVALFYGTRVPAGISLPADVNADGVVNILDLTAVAQGIDATSGGPNQLSLEEVKAAVSAAAEQAEDLEAVAAAPMHFSIRPEGPLSWKPRLSKRRRCACGCKAPRSQ